MPPPSLLGIQALPSSLLYLSNPHQTKLHQSQASTLRFPKWSSFSFSHPLSRQFSLHSQAHQTYDDIEDEELVIGDCVVFEEGIFEDPYAEKTLLDVKPPEVSRKPTKKLAEVKPENLIPEDWKEVQREVNITKKERRKLAYELDFGKRVEKMRRELRPLGNDRNGIRRASVEEYLKYREEKLKQLKPLILDNPVVVKVEDIEEDDSSDECAEEIRGREEGESTMGTSSSGGISSSRVVPKNPRMEVYGGGLEDVSELFRSGNYDPNASKNSQGPRKLFSKEEKVLLNRRVPDLATATSGKWQPLHTLAASGEFYFVNALLKYHVDINVPDKNGLTAIHKAILGKKQAIFNYLLRESANPFIHDKEGASLLHYAVRTASSQMIKILLLYNVDINLQDDDGWTPLHLAVQSRRTDIVKLLLVKGADTTLRNRDGLTPLEMCLFSGRDIRTYELIKLLKQPPRPK